METMSPNIQNDSRRNASSKNCTVTGCGGMMTLHRSQEAASGALSPSSGATWVCDNNPAHIEAAGLRDE
jgi:hypothetical protein